MRLSDIDVASSAVACALPASSLRPKRCRRRITPAPGAGCQVGEKRAAGGRQIVAPAREVSDGVSIVALFMGVFGIDEIIANLEHRGSREVFTRAVKSLMPSREEMRRSIGPICAASIVGARHAAERRQHPERVLLNWWRRSSRAQAFGKDKGS